jgi:hypothetical protein
VLLFGRFVGTEVGLSLVRRGAIPTPRKGHDVPRTVKKSIRQVLACRLSSNGSCELRQAAFRERFENFSMRSVQIRAHDYVRSRSALLAYYSHQSCTDPRR